MTNRPILNNIIRVKLKQKIKRLMFISLIFATVIIISVFSIDQIVKHLAKDKLYDSTEDIPYNKIGLLLGTSKYLKNGNINLYYKYRIDAAYNLYKSGKIDYLLISGDNSRKNYDEPTMMKEDLVKRGVPDSIIYLDYAGFRTLDSVIRCRDIFGQNCITVISQKFHNERAIFIAKRKGISAVGYNAKSVDKFYGMKTRIREKLARVKMTIDLIFNKKPKFSGDKVEIK